MNVERTMEFILESQAKAEARADRADARAARADARADKADARMDRLDKQLKATADLVREGMKIVGAFAKDRRELRQELQKLSKAQARTEAELQRYLKSLRNGHGGSNGHQSDKR